MAMNAGDAAATTGMAKAIYDEQKTVLEADGEWSKLSAGTKDAILTHHKKMAYATAVGIIDHVVANMEVNGIETTLDASLNTIFTAGVPVLNDGGTALQAAWKLATTGGAKDDSTQNNDGTGRVA